MSRRTNELTLTALMFALAFVLSFLESLLPVIPGMPPGARIGLSNIPLMYFLFFGKKRYVFALVLLRSLFVLFTRGAAAGAISLSGGVFSAAVMFALVLIFADRISVFLLSAVGAAVHNCAQLAAASFIYGVPMWFYVPLLVAAGIASGSVTAVLLKLLFGAISKIKTKTGK